MFSDGSQLQLDDDSLLQQFIAVHYVDEDPEREYDFYTAYRLTDDGKEAGLDAA